MTTRNRFAVLGQRNADHASGGGNANDHFPSQGSARHEV